MTEGKRRDVAPIVAPPPVLFVAVGGLAWLAERLAPVSVISSDLPIRLRWALIALAPAAGLLLSAFWEMVRADTPIEPWQPTRRLVTGGPFRWTRNPIYLGLVLLMTALGLAAGSLWFLLAVPALFAVLHFGVILREERYLAGKFGEEYASYRRRVRRWL